jgi:hypothetical protein
MLIPHSPKKYVMERGIGALVGRDGKRVGGERALVFWCLTKKGSAAHEHRLGWILIEG